jgi:adenosylhomocysteine nucleosidase
LFRGEIDFWSRVLGESRCVMTDVVLIALRSEAPELAGLPWVFTTGVGKVNAAIAAARIVERYRPVRLWNFGTAGGVRVGTGLHRCTRFVQRDMRAMGLGFPPGVTPYEKEAALDLGGEGVLCGTGDSFVAGEPLEVEVDVVDMEAYAVAKVCLSAGVEFRCFKFITDRADEASGGDWIKNVRNGENLYIAELKKAGLWERKRTQ